MSKDDQQVLVIPRDILFAKGAWQGLKTDNLEYYLDLIKKHAEFKRRGDMETDPSFQQIIPFIIFSFQDKYFLYKYLPSAGEKRLVDTYQLGVGGHIEPLDHGTENILEAGMMREWEEEVNYSGKFLEKKLVGLLKDDSRPVEQVHLGLIYHFIGDSPDISIKETEKMAGEMVEKSHIEEKLKTNEGIWVKVMYEDYIAKL